MQSFVSISGGYWTGSSAVIDLLTEHRNAFVVPNEFTLFSFGQFFKEIYDPLVNGEVVSKDQAFSTLNLFDGFNRSDLYPLRAFGRKFCLKIGVYPDLFFRRQAGMAKILGPDYAKRCKDFSNTIRQILLGTQVIDADRLREMTLAILKAALPIEADGTASTKLAIFDQLIAPPFIPNVKPSFPEMKCVNVDRDWRDQFISIRRSYKSMLNVNVSQGVKPWDEDYDKMLNLGPTEYFVKLRQMIDTAKLALEHEPDVYWMTFESLIEDPEVQARKLFDFLDLDWRGWCPGQFFLPEISSKRTRKWQRFSGPERVELFDQFEEIAGRLGYAQ